jgi:tetratricopeptide (TPR) repeat protein
MTHSIRTLAQRSLIGLCLLSSGCTGMAMKPYSPPATSPARVSPQKSGTAPTQTASAKADPDQRFNAALKLMKDHQPQEAQAAFAALAKDYPDFSGPLTDLAILYAQSQQRPQAIAGFSKAVSMNPRNAVAWNWLGILYREGGDYRSSENAYLQALSAKPDYAAAHLNLAILYDVAMRRPQDALFHYREYQRTSGKQDLIVSAWIKELEMTAGTTVASGALP